MELQEALRGLDRAADDGIDGAVPPPAGDLWRRGVRWQRVRRRGSMALAALGVVALTALSLVTLQRSTPPEPTVAPGSAPTLPDRVYPIAPWGTVALPGEPVVAAQLTTRSTWSGERNAVAVITGSGRYLYLDLDGPVADRIALSPDGRHVAYWTVGMPDGTPRLRDGSVQSVTHVAVVDVVTGEVVRHRFATQHGVEPSALLWVDDATLLGGQVQWVAGSDGTDVDQMRGNDFGAWLWRPAAGEPLRELDPRAFDGLDSFSEAAGDRVLLERAVVDLDTGERQRVRRTGTTGSAGAIGSSAVLRADGTLVKLGGPGNGGRVPDRLTMSDVDDTSSRPVEVPGLRQVWQVLGWRDATHAVAVRSDPAPSALYDDLQTVSVDVRTGDAVVLAVGGTDMLEWAWAADLLDAPVVPGVAPADPQDPRAVAATAATVVLLTAWLLVLWRRRGRP